MALDADDMTDEIVAKLPSEWIPYWVDGNPPKAWVSAQCKDVVLMWAAIVLSPGSGPPPPGVYVHGHSAITIIPVTTNVAALGYTSQATTFFGTVASQTAAHLLSNLSIADSDGAVTHDHTLSPLLVPQNPFSGLSSTASSLKSSILSMLSGQGIVGANMPDQGNKNSLDILYTAISEGMLEHMEDNGQLSSSVGLSHVHTLS